MKLNGMRLLQCSFLLVIAGCGNGSGQLKLEPVSGTVTLDGKPLPNMLIRLIPTGSTHGTGAVGSTDMAGKYELTAVHGGKGTPVGTYRVVVEKLMIPGGPDSPAGSKAVPVVPAAAPMLPAKYSDRSRTVLTAAVSDGPNTIDFPLSSR